MRAIALAVAWTAGTTLAVLPSARAQGTLSRFEDSYYANDGVHGRYDGQLGEFAPDLGGFIPFARFDDDRALVGHALAQRWDSALAGRTFREMVLESFGDLRALDTQLRQFGRAAVLPIPTRAVVLESPAIPRTTWWGRNVTLHPFRIHGAPALVCIPDATLASPPDPIHLLLVNLPQHQSAFGVNSSHVATAYTKSHSGWGGEAGAPILAPDEQALERGDVVIVSQENLSQSVWIALQRTQEAELFVREQLLPSLGIEPDPASSRSFLYGGSWGGIVSAYLALLQPKVYAGSAAYSMDDWSFGIGDQRLLLSFHAAATGMLAPDLPNDPYYAPFYALVDLLGIRFDEPQTLASGRTMQPWDLSAFCVNRRELELAVPIHGLVAGEDWIFNCHWSATNSAFNPKFQPGLRRFLEHGGIHGFLAGANEYSIWRGDEWQALIAGASPAAANPPLVPDAPLPRGLPAYPDPYTHTLRHVHVPAGPEDFLREIDLSAASHSPGSGVLSLGQGVWPALDDSLFAGNLDDDPRTELVFGNLDGRVHVLELDPARDPADPLKLYDEWRSPYLGREIYSLAVAGRGPGARIFAADGLGQLWRIERKGGAFTVTGAPAASPATAPKLLYPGPTRFLTVGDFVKSRAGLELFAFNRFCDWSLFSATDGAPIPGGRLPRGLHATGPAHAVAADLTGDGDDELLIASHDGFVWAIDPPPGGSFDLAPGANPVAISRFTGLAISRVEPADLDPDPGLSHALVFGQNSMRDADGVSSTNVVLLLDVRSGEIVAQLDAAPNDPLGIVSFDWIARPGRSGSATFVFAGARSVQKASLRRRPGTNGFAMTAKGSIELVELLDESVRGGQIDAIETVRIDGAAHVVVALGNGRFVVLDRDLRWLRTSASEYGADPDVTGAAPELPWHSNRTLARTFACDLVQEARGSDASLYFAEFAFPFLGSPRRHRVGRLVLPAHGDPSWDPYVAAAPNGAGHPSRVDFNRRLRFADADGDGQREPRVYAEVGDFFFDAGRGRLREFCDVAWHPPFFDAADPLDWKLLGGHVFEIDDLATSDYRYLGGFFVPRDPTQPYVDHGGDDWWYPRVGPNRFSGQIANHSQSAFEHTLGASLKVVELTDPADPGRVAPHVVIGTQGGYVFAIEPHDPADTVNGATPSTLSYASVDLGAAILGLDAGNLDDDPDLELAVGSLYDTGSYGDWVSGDRKRNRGHLVVLDPQTSVGGAPGTFARTELDGDDLVGLGEGIGAGVTGVRVDDVDGDGTSEIWCGDAVGHLWLFRRVAGEWRCFFRSADLAAYCGVYNNIHPIKDAAGHTVRLVVVSAGYVMAFDVDWQRLLGG